MLEHLPPWPIVTVVAAFFVLIALGWTHFARKNDELNRAIAAHLDHECKPECVMCQFDAVRAPRAGQ
jgi:hypothetical protein